VEEKLSRRELLRDLVAVGALAWVAPIATSLPAGASTDGKRKCKRVCRNKNADCNHGFTPCSSQLNCPSEAGDGGYCFTTTENTKRCCANQYCSDVGGPGGFGCVSSNQCPSGYVCVTKNGCTGCGDSFGICFPLCKKCHLDDWPPRPVRRLGRTAAGRRY
jgi:hypothetical protein